MKANFLRSSGTIFVIHGEFSWHIYHSKLSEKARDNIEKYVEET